MNIRVEKIPHYDLQVSTCEECKVSMYGSMPYIDLRIKHESESTQFFPAFRTPNIEATKQYLCDTFNLSKIEDLAGKTFYSIAGNSEIFNLVNIKNKKMFNLASLYITDVYKDSLKEHRGLDEYKHVNLDDPSMINFISLNESIKNLSLKDPKFKQIHDDIKKYLLFISLDSTLDEKDDFRPKIKI